MLFKPLAFAFVALSALQVQAQVTADDVVQGLDETAHLYNDFTTYLSSDHVDFDNSVPAFYSELTETINRASTTIGDPKNTHFSRNDQVRIKDSAVIVISKELRFEQAMAARLQISEDPSEALTEAIGRFFLVNDAYLCYSAPRIV